jgi:hypothetical protein
MAQDWFFKTAAYVGPKEVPGRTCLTLTQPGNQPLIEKVGSIAFLQMQNRWMVLLFFLGISLRHSLPRE